MLFEIVLIAALAFQRHLIPVLLVACVACVVRGEIRRRNEASKMSLASAAASELRIVWVRCRTALFASTLVITAACGYVTGHWGAWLFMLVSALAVFMTVRAWKGDHDRPVGSLVPRRRASVG